MKSVADVIEDQVLGKVTLVRDDEDNSWWVLRRDLNRITAVKGFATKGETSAQISGLDDAWHSLVSMPKAVLLADHYGCANAGKMLCNMVDRIIFKRIQI